MTFENIIENIYPLPETSRQSLKEITQLLSFSKNSTIISSSSIAKHIYFVKSGIVRAFASGPDHDITFWFGLNGDIAISMRSYVSNLPGYETIETAVASELYQIDVQKLYELYQSDIHLANWGRQLAEKELLMVETRLIARQFKTATERYNDLLHHSPLLLQYVPLKHIASYLGITQVSLSRIRAEIK